MDVREEPDEGHVAELLVGLEALGEGEGVEALVVQVEDDERGHLGLGGVEERVGRARELGRDVELLGRAAHLRGKHQVADGGENASIHL